VQDRRAAVITCGAPQRALRQQPFVLSSSKDEQLGSGQA
jgi:hypothetical protein